MGFGWGGVWGMGYGRFMGYAMHFPVNQLRGCKMLWGLRGYGFSEVWVKGGSTVHSPWSSQSSSKYKIGLSLHLQSLGWEIPEKLNFHEPHCTIASLTPYEHLQ